jgi:hypothetical protein
MRASLPFNITKAVIRRWAAKPNMPTIQTAVVMLGFEDSTQPAALKQSLDTINAVTCANIP